MNSKIRIEINNRQWSWIIAFVPWIMVFTWLTSQAVFLCDDAFISFRYVRNLIEGKGLVFNENEYVEGYTNFLWVIELAGLWGLVNIRPEQASLYLSMAQTIGCFMLLWGLASYSPVKKHRWLLAWMATGILASSATWAVWSSSGLETRQFSFLIMLAVTLLSHPKYRHNSYTLCCVSIVLAAAEYTRPEGSLIGGLIIFWYITNAFLQKSLNWASLAKLILPFTVLVGLHYLFRYNYYGEWLPNTYYAKHVRPWYESGFRYIGAASIETGLYLLIPLSMISAWYRMQKTRDSFPMLILLLILIHINYLLRIGGDHFEYRPMDFYWPLLALPASEGLFLLVTWMSGWLPRNQHTQWQKNLLLVLSFAIIVTYSSLIQGHILYLSSKVKGRLNAFTFHIELTPTNAPALQLLPGMQQLVKISNRSRAKMAKQFVGLRMVEHRELGELLRSKWSIFEKHSDFFPQDAVVLWGSVGIRPFYLPDMMVIDRMGLVDATVARTPSKNSNHKRMMAHDRVATGEYLQKRGVNFLPLAPVNSKRQALKVAPYAVPLPNRTWLPFQAIHHSWVKEHFHNKGIQYRHEVSPEKPSETKLSFQAYQYIGEAFLGTFEQGKDGWKDVPNTGVITHSTGSVILKDGRPVFNGIGAGFLTSLDPITGSAHMGAIQSPTFVAKPHQVVAFLIAGGQSKKSGLRILVNGQEQQVWYGKSRDQYRWIFYPIHRFQGQEIQLELFDQGSDAQDYIYLEHVFILNRSRLLQGIFAEKEKQAEQQIRQLVKKQQLHLAVQACTEFVQNYPTSAAIFHLRGTIHHQLKQYAPAQKDYTQSISINPTLSKAYINRGNIYAKKQQFTSAIADFDQALSHNQQSAAAYFSRGWSYAQLKRIKPAIQDFTASLTIQPNNSRAYFNRAKLKLQIGDRSGAHQDYQHAAQLGHKEAEDWLHDNSLAK